MSGGERPIRLLRGRGGYHSLFVSGLGPGALYRYRLNRKNQYPDPCSLYQPQGPFGPSMVVDHNRYHWKDPRWNGPASSGQVLYEIHIGAFTEAGTFRSAAAKLPDLKNLGITTLEVMPVAEAQGRCGWGYDGVDLFAPSHNYGEYDDFKYFVDRAHQAGLAVILDVVYNHLGPVANFLPNYCKGYFTGKHQTDWGQAINFYGDRYSQGVRQFYLQNALYWITDFHIDGLRFDASHTIFDNSKSHILSRITQACRKAAGKKRLYLIGENYENKVEMFEPVRKKGMGMDAVWSDDFHHPARIIWQGTKDGYLSDYKGTSSELISAVKQGFLFQGQFSQWNNINLGTSVSPSTPASSFVFYLQNHDQIANSINGQRIYSPSSESLYRALAALFLLAPQTPMLFMGQEFGASSPFVYFCDHDEELESLVKKGRREFLSQFESFRPFLSEVPDPVYESFFKCKLDHRERQRNRPVMNFHRDLLRLRREDPVISRYSRQEIDGGQLNERFFFIRFYGDLSEQRLLVLNLTGKNVTASITDPLIAPPAQTRWRVLWRSDYRRYGGRERFLSFENKWDIPQECAILLASTPKRKKKKR